ncbi:hypothetical protein CHCC20333_2086 [Bacillus paralicheniformis]|uniref:Uncharacterized protein n=1 Tax=Bacillus paralicheniformis TaxID=1648923 RepID=A0A7Z1B355_9BACI|nr:hypothetical protein B4121_2546 [Bacillus paralicheniformis]TWJ42652.1 hypothetical protein CHCC5027_4472 [Bacillus paralicheniformis]TWK83128.1 hypothetical protein CHCC20333_2086 [Bacillus paralicheniformis]TWL38752.1 hypothetical protein CHCC15381_0870 [Bacillus paralicheniformis]
MLKYKELNSKTPRRYHVVLAAVFSNEASAYASLRMGMNSSYNNSS